MLSTMDGTVAAFDARTGTQLFSHRDAKPAVDSWAAPGMPEYVPSLDGLLYRIDHASDEAHIIDGKFISTTANPSTFHPQSDDAPILAEPTSTSPAQHADAVILTSEDSTVMYIDLRTGRIVRQFTYAEAPSSEPLLPGISDHVIVVSRTSVGVKVLEANTGRVLANASLVHTEPSFLDRGKCLPDTSSESFVAYMNEARDRVSVKNVHTGKVLWTRPVPAPVVEAHGMGGVRIAKSKREAEALGPAAAALPEIAPADPDGRNVIISKEGKYVYAIPAASHDYGIDYDDDDDEYLPGELEKSLVANTPRPPRQVRKGAQIYRVSNPRPPSSLSSTDRLLGLGRLPTRVPAASPENLSDVSFTVTLRDAMLGVLALVVVGYIGYVAGSRPRTQKKKKKKRKEFQSHAEGETGIHTRPMDSTQGLDADDNDSLSDEQDLQRNNVNNPNGQHTSETEKLLLNGQRLPDNSLATDANLEISNGSTGSGSGAGGFVNYRTESGWMTVGCLQVSSKVLGVGSHGTVVYEGKMVPGERRVAVKRLLRQFFESARKEISLLVELDEASPHVVRYFAMELDSEFIYLALELCAASLAECVTEKRPPVPTDGYTRGPPPTFTTRALRQLLQGLADLHRAGVVHRDVKPQNVLITRDSAGMGDVKLADVGLALRLAADRSSYTAVTNAGGGVGTTGWRAPEVLSGGRQTKAVDIFAAGCVVSFVLTGGKHPFGSVIFGRDGNIAAGKPSLEALETLGLPEATDIVTKMIDKVANQRPSAEEALRHPFFWTDATKLSFLVDISDRLYDLRHDAGRYTEDLDWTLSSVEACNDWLVKMDMELLMGLGRGYTNTASGLLRVMRNKRNHYSELDPSVQKLLGPLPEEKARGSGDSPESSLNDGDVGGYERNFLTYFTSKVPSLLMAVYKYAIAHPALIDQPHFTRYGLESTPRSVPLPLHPLVKKGRDKRMDSSALGEDVDGLYSQEEEIDGDAIDEDKDVGIIEEGDDRITYHRQTLLAIQVTSRQMRPEVEKRAREAEIYSPAVYDRYRRCLPTNQFDEYDTTRNDESDAQVTATEAPTFEKYPKWASPQGHAKNFGSRTTAYMAGSPSSSRPPGFATNSYMNGNVASHGPHYRRGGNTANATPAPTISQWSGEERVVDFGSLRRKK